MTPTHLRSISSLAALALLQATTALAADAPTAFAQAKPVSEARLGNIVGKADVNQAIVSRNTSSVANNSVGDHNTTGTISFDGQAFQDLRGLSVLSANTGNNVSINAAMNVNVAIRQ